MLSVILCNETVSNDSDVKNHEELSSVVMDYMDVFPEDLTNELVPKRTKEDFTIDLKEELKPINKGLFNMSHTELAEIRK